MSVFLALHLPQRGIDRGRVLAISRNAALLSRFRNLVLREAARSVEAAPTAIERKIEEARLRQLRETFDLAFDGEAEAQPEPAGPASRTEPTLESAEDAGAVHV